MLPRSPSIAVILPALDEAAGLARILPAIPALGARVIVADNGSTDATCETARRLGALVVHEPRRGYGAACLAGVKTAADAELLVFMDADGSDDPREIPLLLAPLLEGRADLVIGSRTLGHRERGALLPQARAGNACAALLIRLLFSARVTDLGPFRAIRAEVWRALAIDDRGYGLPCQTQVRAIARGYRVTEVPVSYRRRTGRSKISGTLAGVWGAGRAIIGTILREYARRPRVPQGGAR